MSWITPVLFSSLLLTVGWLDPRRIPARSEIGRAMKHAGWRSRREVRRALRNGQAVSDPRLAGLAAAVAQEEMTRRDYRGPLRRAEVLMLLAGVAEVVLVVVFGPSSTGVGAGNLGGSILVIFWVVGLRRLTPSHRHPTDRLLTAYRANRSLADVSGPGELDRIRVGMP